MACNLCIEKKKRKKSKRKKPRCDMCTKRSCVCDFRKKKRKRRSKPMGKTNPMEFYNPVGRFMQVGQPSDGFYASMRVNSQETVRARTALPQGNMPGPVLTNMMTQTPVAETGNLMTQTELPTTIRRPRRADRPQQPLSAEPISTQTVPDTRNMYEMFPEESNRLLSAQSRAFAEGMSRAAEDSAEKRRAYQRDRYRINREKELASRRTMEANFDVGGGDDMQQTGFFGEPADLNILPTAAPDLSENV